MMFAFIKKNKQYLLEFLHYLKFIISNLARGVSMYDDIVLTPREREIINYIKDVPLKTMASNMGISYRTLQWHLSKLYAKFRVQNRLQLILKLLERVPEFRTF